MRVNCGHSLEGLPYKSDRSSPRKFAEKILRGSRDYNVPVKDFRAAYSRPRNVPGGDELLGYRGKGGRFRF